jgi:acetyltransferase-like isoleucine patch superfamily enzyme
MPLWRIMGDEAGFARQKIGMPIGYFQDRDCWLDCRGDGLIQIDPEANIGFGVTMFTMSHLPTVGALGPLVGRPVIIRRNAWVASRAILYNCEIGEGAIVALGSVVRSMRVEPYTMVAGNPARVIGRVVGGRWERV